MADDELTFRESLLNTLAGTFSVNQQERAYSEEQLKIFETSEGFGVILTNIILDSSISESIRQLASVLLRQYVDSHWSHEAGEKFKPPETSPQAKAVIRENLPKALQLQSSKIRLCVAYALSSIAHWDWPENWPNFFELLIHAINSGDPNLIHGSVRVMTEFVKEVSDLQMPHVAPILLPNVLNIIQQPEVFSVRTRRRAVDIFNTIADLIALMKEVYKNASKELLYPLLPNFVSCFSKELVTPDGEHSDWGLKMEVLNTLQTLVKGYPRFMSSHITTILPPVWRIFTGSVEYYVRSIVNSVDPHEDPVDEDGEVLSFDNFIYSIFEFITALVEAPKFKKTVKEYLEDILFHTIIYMQITEEQKDQWISNVNQFVEDENEESFSCSVRISAQYLLMRLCEKFNKTSTQALVNAVAKVQQRGDISKAQGEGNWWKYHEVCLLSLGLIQPTILEMLQASQLRFDADAVLIKMMVESCQANDVPFLVGQALWCSSRYVEALSLDHLKTFLQASVVAVQANQPPIMRIYGVKALYGFCEHLKETEKSGLVEPHFQPIATGLVSYATHVTENALALTLETLSIILSMNAEFTASFAVNGDVIPLLNALFLKYGADVHLNSVLGDIFGTLAPNQGCYMILLEKTVPMLNSVIEAPVDKVPLALVPPTLDVLVEIIRHSNTPLPDLLITRSFPAVAQCILRSEDYAVIQSGGECIRAFVSCAANQILAWCDHSGASGLEYVVRVVTHLLDPRLPQNSAVFVGRLINSLVIKAGAQLGDSLQMILRAVLSKLQQSDALNVVQSLLMVFIQLIRFQLEMTLEFLSIVPGPTGKAALDYILTEWCSRQNTFYGAYERKASCDALCKVLQHALNSGDKRFQEIIVPGDAIITDKGIETRSKSKAGTKEFTMIPVGIKIFKLIVNELASEIEKNELAEDNEDEDDDEDEEWEDVDDENENISPKEMTIQNVIEAMFAASSDYPGFDIGDEDDLETDDDPDIKADAINDTNMKLYLSNFIQELSNQSYFVDMTTHLNDVERQSLVKAGFVET